MRLRKLIAEFLSHSAEHHEPSTVRHYRGRLRILLRDYGHKQLRKLKPRHLDKALQKSNHDPETGELWAPDTRKSNAGVFALIQKFAITRGYLKKPIVAKFEKPAGRARERIPTAEEIEAIESRAQPDFLLIYRALRQSGARPGEMATARIEDIDHDNQVIELKKHKTANKTRKPRLIGIGEKLAAIIRESIGDRTSGPIFLRSTQQPWTPQKLSRTYRGLRDAAELPKDLVLYLARHSFATQFYEATEDIKGTADQLGHTNLQTTLRYVKRNKKLLAKRQDVV